MGQDQNSSYYGRHRGNTRDVTRNRRGKGGQPKPATVFAADTNSCTLSRQSENIAALRVELSG